MKWQKRSHLIHRKPRKPGLSMKSMQDDTMKSVDCTSHWNHIAGCSWTIQQKWKFLISNRDALFNVAWAQWLGE